MNDSSGSDDLPSGEADLLIERDETYQHDRYGLVEVSDIWKGVHEVDSARNMNQKNTIIVRFSAEEKGETVDEITDTLNEFLEAIE
ncbi:hypothetical protein HYG81_26060 (plasmid) [Natrinema zhouii]|uniref:hypothetical protein n=1 Tax=Natrinema zhouii TaxID=1710539 RepID=UPI001CFFB766|nr:hypothetical protein [Natrinema zhouii]UHQ99292.1 hypothetical protein HYG81_26060 [Natrinema zhouii]